ncbi:MAG: DoxX family protein [Cyanobacteria bacterium J06614_10]
MKYLPLAARICLSLIFFQAGINHLIGFSEFVPVVAGTGLPLPGLLAAGTVVFQLLGAIALVIGYKAKIGATLLILFLIPASIFFHPPASDLIGFLKNLSLIGGLLMVVAYGAGPVSVESATSASDRGNAGRLGADRVDSERIDIGSPK